MTPVRQDDQLDGARQLATPIIFLFTLSRQADANYAHIGMAFLGTVTVVIMLRIIAASPQRPLGLKRLMAPACPDDELHDACAHQRRA